jgi:DNA-binding LytR/AlgR family response regulator
LKPIKAQELEIAINKYKDFQQSFSKNDYALKIESLIDNLKPANKKYKNRFLVKAQEQLIVVPQEEIAYFFTSNEMVCLVRKDDRQWLVDYTLEELENLLDPRLFFRLNRQLIANIDAIGQINTYFNGKLKLNLQPSFSQEVLVSREKAQAFKNWLEG